MLKIFLKRCQQAGSALLHIKIGIKLFLAPSRLFFFLRVELRGRRSGRHRASMFGGSVFTLASATLASAAVFVCCSRAKAEFIGTLIAELSAERSCSPLQRLNRRRVVTGAIKRCGILFCQLPAGVLFLLLLVDLNLLIIRRAASDGMASCRSSLIDFPAIGKSSASSLVFIARAERLRRTFRALSSIFSGCSCRSIHFRHLRHHALHIPGARTKVRRLSACRRRRYSPARKTFLLVLFSFASSGGQYTPG